MPSQSAARLLGRSYEAMAYAVASMVGITLWTTLGTIKEAKGLVVIALGFSLIALEKTHCLGWQEKTEGLKATYEVVIVDESLVLTSP